MIMSNAAVGTLRIRDAVNTKKYYSVVGVASTVNDTDVAEQQTNKLYDIAGISVVGGSDTTLTIAKKVN